MLSSRRCFVAVILVLALDLGQSFAQQPGPTKSGPAATKASSSAGGASESAAKEKIFASPQWKQVYDEFQKWLASQAIYTPADVERIKKNLLAQMQSMSAGDLQGFLDDWQAKLKVLNGKDFQDAQQWLGEYLSVLNDGFRRQTLRDLGLSDVANMTAGQLEEAIIRIRANRLSTQQRQAAFDQRRQQMVGMVQQSNAATQQAQQQPGTGAAVRHKSAPDSPAEVQSTTPTAPTILPRQRRPDRLFLAVLIRLCAQIANCPPAAIAFRLCSAV